APVERETARREPASVERETARRESAAVGREATGRGSASLEREAAGRKATRCESACRRRRSPVREGFAAAVQQRSRSQTASPAPVRHTRTSSPRRERRLVRVNTVLGLVFSPGGAVLCLIVAAVWSLRASRSAALRLFLFAAGFGYWIVSADYV